MEEILKASQSYLEKRDTPFIVLIQPSQVDLTESYYINFNVLSAYKNYDRRRLTDSVVNACNKNNILHVNLYESFNRTNPSSLYFRGKNNHWNEKGQDLAARVLSDFIKNNNLIKPVNPPEHSLSFILDR